MENFEIMYRGIKLQASRDNNGSLSIQLPEREGNYGSKYLDRIDRVENGWRYSSIDSNNPEYYYLVWLNDDRSMGWTNDIENGKLHQVRDKFDPKLPNGTNIINDQCKIIYEVLQKVVERDLLGMSAEDVLALRQEWLDTSLQILGYSSTDRVKEPLNDSAGYMALGLIHHQLGGEENGESIGIRNLGSYVFQKVSADGKKSCGFNIPKGIDRAELKKMVQQLQINVDTNRELIATQDGNDGKDGKNELIRGILPDYCLNMKGKIPKEHWKLYSSVVADTAKLLMEINYDLVPELDKRELEDATKLDELDFNHKIGLVIDTTEAAIACSIDDVFVMEETERVSDTAEALIGESDRVRNSSVGAALEFLKDQAMITREKKEKYYETFDELDKKYRHTGFWNEGNKTPPKTNGEKEGKNTDEEYEY